MSVADRTCFDNIKLGLFSMPNTLTHLGTQGLISTKILEKNDFKWVFIGCILPDLPWILKRILLALKIPISPYDLQLYTIAQSSLAGCLLLSIAIACLSSNYKRVFLILFLNSIFHLLLDSLQIKWANGVHFFAPFSWQLIRFDLFWPESVPTLILSISGILFVVYSCFKLPVSVDDIQSPQGRLQVIFILSLVAYILTPVLFIEKSQEADNHFIKTLREVEYRQGRLVEMDRRPIYPKNGKCVLKTPAKEELILKGLEKECHGLVSIRAKFINKKTIHAIEIHRHWGKFRDILSYIGLSFVGFFWLRCLKEKFADTPT